MLRVPCSTEGRTSNTKVVWLHCDFLELHRKAPNTQTGASSVSHNGARENGGAGARFNGRAGQWENHIVPHAAFAAGVVCNCACEGAMPAGRVNSTVPPAHPKKPNGAARATGRTKDHRRNHFSRGHAGESWPAPPGRRAVVCPGTPVRRAKHGWKGTHLPATCFQLRVPRRKNTRLCGPF